MSTEIHKRLDAIQEEMYQVQKNDNMSAYQKREQLSRLRSERAKIDAAKKNIKPAL